MVSNLPSFLLNSEVPMYRGTFQLERHFRVQNVDSLKKKHHKLATSVQAETGSSTHARLCSYTKLLQHYEFRQIVQNGVNLCP